MAASRIRVKLVLVLATFGSPPCRLESLSELPNASDWQVNGIVAALQDQNPDVQILGLRHIRRFGPIRDERLQLQVAHFLNGDPPIRRAEAAGALGEMQARQYVPQLAALLQDRDDIVRLYAVGALRAIGSADCAQRIAIALGDRDSSVRISAVNAITELGATQFGDRLSALLADSDLTVRSSAIKGLGKLRARTHTVRIVELTRNDNPVIAAAAIEAIGLLGDSSQFPELLRLMQSFGQRFVPLDEVAEAMGLLRSSEYVPQVAALMNSPYREVRRAAVQALAAMNSTEHIPAIHAMLQDDEPRVRAAVLRALGKLKARRYAAEVGSFLEGYQIEVVNAAIESLGDMQAEDQAHRLVELAGGAAIWNAESCYLIIDALVRIGGHVSAENVAKSDHNSYAPCSPVRILGAMKAKKFASLVATHLDDYASKAAVEALVSMQAVEYAPQLLSLSSQMDRDPEVVDAALDGLLRIGRLASSDLHSISMFYYQDHRKQAKARFLALFATGGDRDVQRVLRHVMLLPTEASAPVSSLNEARGTIIAFKRLMPDQKYAELNREASRQIIKIARDWRGQWSGTDFLTFNSLIQRMESDNALLLKGALETPWWWVAFEWGKTTISLHLTFWTVLILAYPRSKPIQAFFFWNKWARRFLGLGYVDLALTWIPLLRRRLLAPFHDALVRDAFIVEHSDAAAHYFNDVDAFDLQSGRKTKLNSLVLDGRTVLEGESGIGKSMFLRHLVANAQVPTVFLLAKRCENGVLPAIQRCVEGYARDEAFLKTLVWCGGLRVIIDGINEVSTEVRERIRAFWEDFPRAHIILATQPLPWKRPVAARVIKIEPLSGESILDFLESRFETFQSTSHLVDRSEYLLSCERYVREILFVGSGTGAVVSGKDSANPMDLSTIAYLLVQGITPNLSSLQRQQVDRIEQLYRELYRGVPFPTKQLCAFVYERYLSGDLLLIPPEQLLPAFRVMTDGKMLLEQKEANYWVFRHEKIRDFFLMNALLAQNPPRLDLHLDDPRFRGVYLMLAFQLPLERALEIRELVLERAGETQEFDLAAEVGKIVGRRKPRGGALPEIDLA